MPVEEIDLTTVNPVKLSTELMKKLLSLVRSKCDEPWEKMSETKQQKILDELEWMATGVIRECCQVVAVAGRIAIPVKLEKVMTNGTSIEAKITMPAHSDERQELFDAAGGAAFVVLGPDAKKYEGTSGDKPKAAPDQPAIPGTQTPLTQGQQPGQPDWNAVSEAVHKDEKAAPPAPVSGPLVKKSTAAPPRQQVKPKAPTVGVVKAGDDLIEADDMDEDGEGGMSKGELDRVVGTIPNPVKNGAPPPSVGSDDDIEE